jgi:hypothetical protein
MKMKNRLGVFLLLSIIPGLLFIISCKKSSPAPAATAVNILQANINGVTTTANAIFVVNLNVFWFNINNPITLRSDTGSSINPIGSYIAFTFTDDTSTYAHSYKGYCHGFTFSQLNLNQSYDTTGYVIRVFSSNTSTIVPGTYKIWADTFNTIPPPNAGTIFATARGVYSGMTGFQDSTSIGTITITQMDYINKLASGTFNFINYGKSVNGIVPSINVSNGQFNSLPFEY